MNRLSVLSFINDLPALGASNIWHGRAYGPPPGQDDDDTARRAEPGPSSFL
jgi:hypothetical protein